jgi:hypothetical protein
MGEGMAVIKSARKRTKPSCGTIEKYIVSALRFECFAADRESALQYK